jgi:putative DNA primase/helicase
MKERLDGAETLSIWSLPDMTVVNGGRREPVQMPPELFGQAWPLLTAIAEGTASPPDYAAIGFVAAAASLIGGKRRVRPYPSSAWSEPCILWCGAVGDPSTRKSPSLEAVTDALRLIERDHAEAHRENLRDWQNQCAISKATREDWQGHIKKSVKEGKAAPGMPLAAIEPDEPSRRRTMVIDATPEAVGVILSGNAQGTMHFRDELAGWLQSFDRYSPGGREFWLEAYGGRPFVIDRKGAKEPLTIPFNGVTVLGGIQPAKLAGAFLDSPDDGLIARFIWAWPDKVAFRRPQRLADMSALESAYRRLDSLSWAADAEGRQAPIVVPLSAQAADVFERWQADNAAIDDDSSSLFKSFVGKMDGVVLRLALVAEFTAWAFRGGEEPRQISLD